MLRVSGLSAPHVPQKPFSALTMLVRKAPKGSPKDGGTTMKSI